MKCAKCRKNLVYGNSESYCPKCGQVYENKEDTMVPDKKLKEQHGFPTLPQLSFIPQTKNSFYVSRGRIKLIKKQKRSLSSLTLKPFLEFLKRLWR